MSSTHSVDLAKWSKLDIFNQMGNIYSEVGRSYKTSDGADLKNHEAAVSRAIDLFDATIKAQVAAKSPKAKEVARAKEQFLLSISYGANQSEKNSLDRYFMQFAVAARLKH